MARKRYYRNNDEEFLIGLIILIILGAVYSFLMKYWLVTSIIF